MLFTQATEVGIQLENALILSPKSLAKAQIPANNERILNWAKDNHVVIRFDSNPKSDFNCVLGIMMDERVSDSTMSTNKKMLKHLGEDLVKFIDDMSENVDEANKDAETREKVAVLVDKFKSDVKELCGEDTIINVEVFTLRTASAKYIEDILTKALGMS